MRGSAPQKEQGPRANGSLWFFKSVSDWRQPVLKL